MEIGEVYIVAETGKFFQVRSIHDDFIVIGGHTDFYEDAKTTKMGNAQVSYGYVESAVQVVTIDTLPGMFHNGIGWKHLMTETDPQHPKIWKH